MQSSYTHWLLYRLGLTEKVPSTISHQRIPIVITVINKKKTVRFGLVASILMNQLYFTKRSLEAGDYAFPAHPRYLFHPSKMAARKWPGRIYPNYVTTCIRGVGAEPLGGSHMSAVALSRRRVLKSTVRNSGFVFRSPVVRHQCLNEHARLRVVSHSPPPLYAFFRCIQTLCHISEVAEAKRRRTSRSDATLRKLTSTPA